jgi:ferredoxin
MMTSSGCEAPLQIGRNKSASIYAHWAHSWETWHGISLLFRAWCARRVLLQGSVVASPWALCITCCLQLDHTGLLHNIQLQCRFEVPATMVWCVYCENCSLLCYKNVLQVAAAVVLHVATATAGYILLNVFNTELRVLQQLSCCNVCIVARHSQLLACMHAGLVCLP